MKVWQLLWPLGSAYRSLVILLSRTPWLPGIIHDILRSVQFESIAVPERQFSLNTVRFSRTFEKTRLRA